MKIDRLKQAKNLFFCKYLDGFDHPELVAIGKKHKMNKLIEFAETSFDKDEFKNPEQILENLSKTVTKVSMASLFEKPKLRDFTYALSLSDRQHIIDALYNLLNGNMTKGFEAYCDVLRESKLAKWSLMTIVLAYYRPKKRSFRQTNHSQRSLSPFRDRRPQL